MTDTSEPSALERAVRPDYCRTDSEAVTATAHRTECANTTTNRFTADCQKADHLFKIVYITRHAFNLMNINSKHWK
jgi:hypothetical protein